MVRKTISKRAFTIVEIMIAVGVFFIAFLGTSMYRYGASLDARKADLQTKATRTALLFCEGWKGVGGATTFKPVTSFNSDITISVSVGPDVPSGFTLLGSYKVNFERTEYYVTLSWKQMNADLKALSIIVSWDPTGQNTGSFADAKKSYWLTTYVENPY
jgi:type II secretory pathway pseudopilin PulG